ncbi:MAG TPA: biotin/lipoyl-containing protein [Terriglobales bacterium]|nr:biotin/lipoyl-containing protein [Terriglobales bacterium]
MKVQIVIDGQAYEVEVDLADQSAPAHLPGTATIYSTVVPTAQKSAPAETGVDESKICRSPVNGLVVTVVAKIGDPVEPGDLVLMLEAMKMQTRVTAPLAAAKVKAILVSQGEAVKLNQILVEFE